MISMSRSFTRIALPYSLLVFRSTNEPILLSGTPTPKNKYRHSLLRLEGRRTTVMIEKEDRSAHSIIVSQYSHLFISRLLFPLSCKCSAFCISISPRVVGFWLRLSIHSAKTVNSCIIFMLRYALCPIQRYDSCKMGAARYSERANLNSDTRKTSHLSRQPDGG